MFDVGASELLMIVIVAVVVIGPKDMPMAMRTAGRWIGKIRKVSNHFRSGIDAMVREAELEEMERKWREQNEAIMKAAPQISPLLPTAEEMQAPHRSALTAEAGPEPAPTEAPSSPAEGLASPAPAEEARQSELHLPPPPP